MCRDSSAGTPLPVFPELAGQCKAVVYGYDEEVMVYGYGVEGLN